MLIKPFTYKIPHFLALKYHTVILLSTEERKKECLSVCSLHSKLLTQVVLVKKNVKC